MMFFSPVDDAITLHYQPLARPGGKIGGMEALMRWHHHQRGTISPEAFIPVFEQSGLIVPLSAWALAQACVDAAAWEAPLIVAVNVSTAQFSSDLAGLAAEALARSGLAPERLELEIKAEALGDAVGDVRGTMARLRDLGVQLALANFGVGGAGSQQLRDFPVTKIKIARELVAGIADSSSARSIIHMATELGHSLGLSVAAEGIETVEQLAFLEAAGCDWLQGFLIGCPAAIEEHAQLTESNESSPVHRLTAAPKQLERLAS